MSGIAEAVSVFLKIGVPILGVLAIIFLLERFGVAREQAAQRKREAKQHAKFEKEGEAWRAAGGMRGAIARKLRDIRKRKV